jgi:hypothetical protein
MMVSDIKRNFLLPEHGLDRRETFPANRRLPFMKPSAASIQELLWLKYGPLDAQGWAPRLRAKYQ